MTDEAFQRPDRTAAPQSLVRLLQDFTLEANRYVDTAGGRNDMHRTDLNALAVIMRHTAKGHGGHARASCARNCNLSSPATTALIDRLDNSGHVVRERHGSDRRQVQLRMTPKAFQDGGAMFMPLSRHMGTAMAEFSPEELELVTRFHDRHGGRHHRGPRRKRPTAARLRPQPPP